MPKVPDITPEFDLERDEAITLLLASIAMEELGLAHILNAEGEKVQYLLGPKNKEKLSAEQLLKVNGSVESVIRSVTRLQIILSDKLDNLIRLLSYESCEKETECAKAPCALRGSGFGCVSNEQDFFRGATAGLEAIDEKFGHRLWKYTLTKRNRDCLISAVLTPLSKNLNISCGVSMSCPTPEKPHTFAMSGRGVMLVTQADGTSTRATVNFSLQVWDYGIGTKFQVKTWHRGGDDVFQHDSGVVRVTSGDLRIEKTACSNE